MTVFSNHCPCSASQAFFQGSRRRLLCNQGSLYLIMTLHFHFVFQNCDGEGSFKKGLLWQQRDKLFSRWKERYFILTKDYFHCFKKASSRITEMGGFIFKVPFFLTHDNFVSKNKSDPFYMSTFLKLLKVSNLSYQFFCQISNFFNYI